MPVVEGLSRSNRSPGSANKNVRQLDRLTPKPPKPPARRSSTSERRKPTLHDLPIPVRFAPPPQTRQQEEAEIREQKRRRAAAKAAANKKGKANSSNPRGVAAAEKLAGSSAGGSGGNVIAPKKLSRNLPLHPDSVPTHLHVGGVGHHPGYMRRIPVEDQKQSFDYRFYFLYNPFSISMGTSLNLDATYDKQDKSYNLFAGQQSIGFSVFINRQNDIRQDGAARGGIHLNKAQLHELHHQGTLHDIEALYRVLNGDPQDLYNAGPNVYVTGRSADMGFITGSPVELVFGPQLKFIGFVTQVDIEHKVFNRAMVPIMSEIGISLTRLSGVKPASATTTSSGSSGSSGPSGKGSNQ